MTSREKFDIINSNVKKSAEKSGRKAADITVLAVTKTVSVDRILPVLDMGITEIGENYVQELCEKYDALKEKVEKFHFIGHLQTNKVKYIIDKVSLIHSVDRMSLLTEINKRADAVNKIQDILIEVNMTKEETKSGVYLENLEELLKSAEELPNISVKGFMTMPPAYFSKEEAAAVYKKLADISKNIKTNGSILSMGMSGDYEKAIENGSNLIRLGALIFGKRNII